MNKLILKLGFVTAILLAAVCTYVFVYRTEVVVEPAAQRPSSGQAPTPDMTKKQPDHGNFEQRFKPVPPPPTQGKSG